MKRQTTSVSVDREIYKQFREVVKAMNLKTNDGKTVTHRRVLENYMKRTVKKFWKNKKD